MRDWRQRPILGTDRREGPIHRGTFEYGVVSRTSKATGEGQCVSKIPSAQNTTLLTLRSWTDSFRIKRVTQISRTEAAKIHREKISHLAGRLLT